MKMYRWFALLTLLSLLLASCAGGAAEPGASKELNLYAWSEYVPQALLDNFAKETGIQVNYDTYSSNEELLAKLQAGASGYDVIIPSDYTVMIMINQNMLEPLDMAQIPNFANIADNMKALYFDPENKYSVPYQWGTTGIAYDTAKVTRPITSWNDLWDPAFEGQLLLPDDVREVLGMSLASLGYSRNTTDPAQLEEAKAKLLTLMPNVRLFDSDSPKTPLIAGEVSIAMTWNGEAVGAQLEKDTIEYICPVEGCTIFWDTLAIPKGAPHKDAAHAFINYVLSPEASILITEEFNYSNPNQAALELLKTADPALYERYMGSTATNPPAQDIENAEPIFDVGEATAIYDRIWTEVKGGE